MRTPSSTFLYSTEGNLTAELVHTIQYPSAQQKLILSDPALPAEIQERLLKDTATHYVFAIRYRCGGPETELR